MVLLNTADSLRKGSSYVDRVYEGTAVVWSWSPKNVPGLFAWYSADSIAQANGSGVTAWADLSGNGLNLTQPASSLWPTYAVNAINGHAAIRVNPASAPQGMSSARGVNAPGTAATVYVVRNSLAIGTDYQSSFTHRSGTSGNEGAIHYVYPSSAGNGNLAFWSGSSGSSWTQFVPFPGVPAPEAAYCLMSSRHDTAVTAWQNGTLLGSAAGQYYPVISGTSSINIGWGNDGGYAYGFNGYIAEVLYYAVAHTDSQRKLVEHYLLQKYGL